MPTASTLPATHHAAPHHPVPSTPAPAPAEHVALPAPTDVSPEPEQEENIYEVMKQHMARKKEELDAQNAQLKQHRPGQRPGPVTHTPPAPPPVEKAPDLADLPGVWLAARNYLALHARLLESVLGNCSQITALNVAGSDITLTIPNTQRNFTNDRARAKLEEALRAVTDLPLKLALNFVDPPDLPPGTHVPGTGNNIGTVPLAAAQRVPPEVMDAVKKQPVIRELMKRLDATVTQVEILDETPEN